MTGWTQHMGLPSLRAIDRMLLRDMWRRRGQLLAIALVIAAAVATLVMALSALRSLSDARERFAADARFGHVFVSLRRAPDSSAERLREIPGVAAVDTRVASHVTLYVEGVSEPLRGLAVSLPRKPDAGLGVLTLRRGHWPRVSHPDEILLHEGFARARALQPGARIAAVMNGRRRVLTVTGMVLSPEYVYVIGPGDLVPDDARYGVFWMQRAPLAASLDFAGAFNEAVLLLRRDAALGTVIERVDNVLARFGGHGAYGRDQQVSNAFVDGEFEQLRTMARVIPPIFLIVSAFLLYTVIARQIETQREEIGLLKAFGYSDAAVGWHYVKFALVVSAVALALGWSVGAWLGQAITELYRDYFRFPVLVHRVTADVLLLSGAVAVAASTAGALLAARKATRLSPAVAMSPPQPSMYRHGAFERLRVFRGLRSTGNMVLRHVLRYPLRAGVTVLGIAASVALLVSTLQFLDSIDQMVDDYFFRAQRQDVTVRLVDPRTPGVRNDLARLPGVLRVELRRSVAVRLRHGARSRRGVVQGIEHDATLAQQIDRAGHVVPLPANGIVLSQRLAEHLDVQPGNFLDVEFLEGRQRKASVRVAQVISEYVGLAAYMDLDALGRLSGDGSIADTAVLRTDAAATDQLFARAREAPGIFTVALQRTAYLKFRALLDQNIVTMLGFYVAFAAIIAFGVAYNAGRITFSERAREFATLRVLGYQASEVAGILLGELAVLTWIGLALGCVLGYGLAWLMIALFSSDLYQMPFALEPPTYAWSAIVALLAGGGSGALVARRVRKLDLVRVLKARD